MNTDLMFSSESHMWETPQDFFDKLNAIYKFDLDVCAIPENAKCERFFTPEQDGLKQQWQGVCWMNPPYGRAITDKWIKKAYESAQAGATVVCLIPSRTDTKYWHDYVMKGEITFVKGRLKFGGHKDAAPFPSAVVVFKGETVSVQRQDLKHNDHKPD
jgi:phage N-6-adenine-methyltransferase